MIEMDLDDIRVLRSGGRAKDVRLTLAAWHAWASCFRDFVSVEARFRGPLADWFEDRGRWKYAGEGR